MQEDIKESELYKVLGLKRRELAKLREKHVSLEYWYRDLSGGRPSNFGVVWIKPEGVKQLYQHLKLEIQQEPSPEKISSANAELEVSVIRADFPNNRIVQVSLEDGTKKMMRVRDSRMWVQGMKVMARPEGALDMTLIPVRHPRFRGRL